MAGRHGHKSAVAVQDAPAGPRHRSPHDASSTASDLVPEPRGGAAPSSTPATPARRRWWPWVVAAAVLLVAVVVGVNGGGSDTAPPAEPTPAPALAPASPAATAPAPSAAPGTVTLPRIGGRNAATALTELRRLGLVVRLVTDDDRTVDDPAKWTVIGLQPKPGTAVTTGRTIVVTVSQDD